jgi:rubrerythrin
MVVLLRNWQDLEVKGITSLTELQGQTDNPILKEVLEIIKQDSGQHRRVQQMMIDGLTKEAFTLTPEEVSDIWEKLDEHDRLEQATITLAHNARRAACHPVIRYFLSYLLADEEKHHRMLESLEDIKRNLYPYGW